MKNYIIISLLAIGLIITGCGSAGTRHSNDSNIPVISYVSAEANDARLVTIAGSNFGSVRGDSDVYFGVTPLKTNDGSGSWSDSSIKVRLYDETLSKTPEGRFKVVVNGVSSNYSEEYTPLERTVNSVSPQKAKEGDIVTLNLSGEIGSNMSSSVTFFDMSDPANFAKTACWKNTSRALYCYVPRLPKPIEDENTAIGIKIGTYTAGVFDQAYFGFRYEFEKPEITSIMPTEGVVIGKSTITVFSRKGGFGRTRGDSSLSVVSGGSSFPITSIESWSDNNISFRIPSDGFYDSSSDKISVRIYVRGTTIESTQIGIRPDITDVSVSVASGGFWNKTYTYIVRGSGFSRQCSVKFNVFSEGTQPMVSLNSSRQITITSKEDYAGRQMWIENSNGANSSSNWVTVPAAE